MGERETIDLATGRFVQVVSEYFAVWAEYEDGLSDEFSGWLPALRDLVLNEVGDLWKGRGDWFERVCVQKLNTPSTDREPSRDKGKFAPIMNEWSAKARSVEMARINSAALTPNKLRSSGDGQRFGDTWKSTDQVEFQSPHSADSVIPNSGPRPQPPVNLTVQASTGVSEPTQIAGESLVRALTVANHPLVTAEILQSPVEKSLEPSGGYEGKPTCWRDVGLRFTSEHRVQISINGIVGESYGYADLGFEDKRTGKPNQAWDALYKLAEKQGRYDVTKMGGRPRAQLEKRFQEIRNRLCNHFKVGGDPVPFEKGNGYQAAFGISVSPAIIFEAPKIRRTCRKFAE